MFANPMLKMFSLPYPESASKKEIFLSSFFIAMAVYLFLVIFQPFGTHSFSDPFKYLLLTPYSLIAFLVFTGANLVFKNRSGQWNVLKEVIKTVIALLFCAILNYYYNIQFINHTAFHIYDLVSMSLFTLAVGIPLCSIYLLGRYLGLKKTTLTIEAPVALKLPEPIPAERVLSIKSDVGKAVFQLREHDFLFAESKGNYCMITYLDGDKVKTELLRLSLLNLEEQANCSNIVRCHRSFIVNTARINQMKGNAQGYKLNMDGSESQVPVSRKYITVIPKQCPEDGHS